ncbi:MAG: 30S ribosomal protein S12 methylthiotransferase RimO [Rickettsiales bacterium]|jgi:ribosomal protein S12 methylthiotransferase
MKNAKIISQKPAPRVGFVSLGCAKALVDSERILTQLRSEGYEFSGEYGNADVVIVNTCGFLDSAREESLSAIGEALAENGKVIVTGCMGATPELIRNKFPHVLSITGPQQYESVVEAVHEAVPPLHEPYLDLVPPQGVKLTPRHYAYLKISEGCNNRCSFCIIPKLRGDLVSRPAADVLGEAERLVASGVKELLVVSQDTSAYGIDVKYSKSVWKGIYGNDREIRARFYDLCSALGELGAWVRLHYVYPYPHVSEVVQLMAEGKILPYLDIPFQHASPKVLKKMRRPANQEKVLEQIASWRKICPEITIRSTFIVGFPDETEEDFQFLLDWLKKAELDRVGCFRYENVADADSNALPNHVPQDVIEDRWNRFMQVQQKISAKCLKKKVGKILPVLIDSVSAEGIVGRSYADAPEIDGVVHVTSKGRVLAGTIVKVLIEKSDAYDLHGSVVIP